MTRRWPAIGNRGPGTQASAEISPALTTTAVGLEAQASRARAAVRPALNELFNEQRSTVDYFLVVEGAATRLTPPSGVREPAGHDEALLGGKRVEFLREFLAVGFDFALFALLGMR